LGQVDKRFADGAVVIYGTHWMADELDEIVADYSNMLTKELSSIPCQVRT